MTRTISIIKQSVEKATQELTILEDQLKSIDTINLDKCGDALYSLRNAADLMRSQAVELLIDIELGRFP
jgi:hypothetical protein